MNRFLKMVILAAATAGAVAASALIFSKKESLQDLINKNKSKLRETEDGGYVADVDGDGKDDFYATDTFNDGKIDTVAIDTNGDGTLDTSYIDLDGDGIADIVVEQNPQ